MNKISFFTPVFFEGQDRTFPQKVLTKVDGYLSLSGKKAVVASRLQGNQYSVQMEDRNTPFHHTALKVASYFTLVLPLIALAIKTYLRGQYEFVLQGAPPPSRPASVELPPPNNEVPPTAPSNDSTDDVPPPVSTVGTNNVPQAPEGNNNAPPAVQPKKKKKKPTLRNPEVKKPVKNVTKGAEGADKVSSAAAIGTSKEPAFSNYSVDIASAENGAPKLETIEISSEIEEKDFVTKMVREVSEKIQMVFLRGEPPKEESPLFNLLKELEGTGHITLAREQEGVLLIPKIQEQTEEGCVFTVKFTSGIEHVEDRNTGMSTRTFPNGQVESGKFGRDSGELIEGYREINGQRIYVFPTDPRVMLNLVTFTHNGVKHFCYWEGNSNSFLPQGFTVFQQIPDSDEFKLVSFDKNEALTKVMQQNNTDCRDMLFDEAYVEFLTNNPTLVFSFQPNMFLEALSSIAQSVDPNLENPTTKKTLFQTLVELQYRDEHLKSLQTGLVREFIYSSKDLIKVLEGQNFLLHAYMLGNVKLAELLQMRASSNDISLTEVDILVVRAIEGDDNIMEEVNALPVDIKKQLYQIANIFQLDLIILALQGECQPKIKGDIRLSFDGSSVFSPIMNSVEMREATQKLLNEMHQKGDLKVVDETLVHYETDISPLIMKQYLEEVIRKNGLDTLKVSEVDYVCSNEVTVNPIYRNGQLIEIRASRLNALPGCYELTGKSATREQLSQLMQLIKETGSATFEVRITDEGLMITPPTIGQFHHDYPENFALKLLEGSHYLYLSPEDHKWYYDEVQKVASYLQLKHAKNKASVDAKRTERDRLCEINGHNVRGGFAFKFDSAKNQFFTKIKEDGNNQAS